MVDYRSRSRVPSAMQRARALPVGRVRLPARVQGTGVPAAAARVSGAALQQQRALHGWAVSV